MNTGYHRWLVMSWLAWTAMLLAVPVSASRLSVDVVDSEGMPLKDAVVELYTSAGPAAPTSSGEMAQRDRAFHPHVMAVPTGSAVAFPNRDDTRHHVYSFSPAKRFELKLYLNEPMPPVVFDTPGVVVLGCNIHDHMQAFILVSEASRMAVTGDDGHLTFDDLPDQPIRLTAWHPRLSRDHEQRRELQVVPHGQAVSIPLTLSVPVRPTPSPSSLQQLFDRATH